MIDVQNGLGLKNISHLLRKQIQGMYQTRYPTEEQKRKCMRTEEELTKKTTDSIKITYAGSDFMRKIIKSSRGVKECNDGIDRSEKEKRRGNFRTILGFKENDIMKVTEQTQSLKNH